MRVLKYIHNTTVWKCRVKVFATEKEKKNLYHIWHVNKLKFKYCFSTNAIYFIFWWSNKKASVALFIQFSVWTWTRIHVNPDTRKWEEIFFLLLSVFFFFIFSVASLAWLLTWWDENKRYYSDVQKGRKKIMKRNWLHIHSI